MANRRKGKNPEGEPSQPEPEREEDKIKPLKIEFDKVENYIKPKNEIGEGAFRKVYKGSFEEREVAIKVSRNKHDTTRKQWQDEINHLSNIKHENIIALLAYGEGGANLFLIFEYLPHSLQDACEGLMWPQIRDLIVQVAKALRRLHDSKPPLTHGDLKLKNILLDKEGRAKLCDFGTTQKENLDVIMTTQEYAPPELTNRTGRLPKVTRLCDIYSLGICILKLMQPKIDFKDSAHQERKGKGKEKDKTLAEVIQEQLKQKPLSSKLLESGSITKPDFNKMIELGLSCAQKDDTVRPNIARVLQTLETII